jgi:dienelactone hydrolase
MKTVLVMVAWALSLSVSSFAADNRDLFRDDASRPLQITEKSAETHGTAVVHDIRFAGVDGEKIEAYQVTPAGKGPFAAILFVHWLGEPATTNRTQFLNEAEALADSGVTSLLVNMPWSVPQWFESRKLDDDYDFSIRQVKNLRRALDVLSGLKGVDKKRIAFVGHDFGATYGAMLLGVDSRPRCAVLMAGTPVLSDWFLLDAKIAGQERENYIKKIAPLDPTNYLGKAKLPILFQFSNKDEYIPKDKAQMFVDAAKSPKQLLWYDAGHGLSVQAGTDRDQWLKTQLKLAH